MHRKFVAINIILQQDGCKQIIIKNNFKKLQQKTIICNCTHVTDSTKGRQKRFLIPITPQDHNLSSRQNTHLVDFPFAIYFLLLNFGKALNNFDRLQFLISDSHSFY